MLYFEYSLLKVIDYFHYCVKRKILLGLNSPKNVFILMLPYVVELLLLKTLNLKGGFFIPTL